MLWPRWLNRVFVALNFIVLIAIPISLQFTSYLTKSWLGNRHYNAEYKAILKEQGTKTPEGCKAILQSEDLWGQAGSELWYHRRACDGMNEALIKIKKDKEAEIRYSSKTSTNSLVTSIATGSSASEDTNLTKSLVATLSHTTPDLFTTTTIESCLKSTGTTGKGLLQSLTKDIFPLGLPGTGKHNNSPTTWLGKKFEKLWNLTQVIWVTGSGTDNNNPSSGTIPTDPQGPNKLLDKDDTLFGIVRSISGSIFKWFLRPTVKLPGGSIYQLSIITAKSSTNIYNGISAWWAELTDFGHIGLRQQVTQTCSLSGFGSPWKQCHRAIDELGGTTSVFPNEKIVRNCCFLGSDRKPFYENSFVNEPCAVAVDGLLQELQGVALATKMSQAFAQFLEKIWILWAWVPAVFATIISATKLVVAYLSEQIKAFNWTFALLFVSWITARDGTLATEKKAILVLGYVLVWVSVFVRGFNLLESIEAGISIVVGLIVVLRHEIFIDWLRAFRTPARAPHTPTQRGDDGNMLHEDSQIEAHPFQGDQGGPAQGLSIGRIWLDSTINFTVSTWDTTSAVLSTFFSPIFQFIGRIGNSAYYYVFTSFAVIRVFFVFLWAQLLSIVTNAIFLSFLSVGLVGSALHLSLAKGILEPIFGGLAYTVTTLYLVPGMVIWAALAVFLLNMYGIFVIGISAGQKTVAIVTSFIFLLYNIELVYALGNGITSWVFGVWIPIVSTIILTLCSWDSQSIALRQALHQAIQNGRALQYMQDWAHINTDTVSEYSMWMIFMVWYFLTTKAVEEITAILIWSGAKHASFRQWFTAKLYTGLASGGTTAAAAVGWLQTNLVLTAVFDFFWHNWLLVLTISFARCSSHVFSFLRDIPKGNLLGDHISEFEKLVVLTIGFFSVGFIVYRVFSRPRHARFGASVMDAGLEVMEQRSLCYIAINAATFVVYYVPAHVFLNLRLFLLHTLIEVISNFLGQDPISFWPINMLYFASALQVSSWRFLAYYLIWRFVKWARGNRGAKRQQAAWQVPTSILLYAFVSNYLANDINQLSASHLQWLHQTAMTSEYLGEFSKLLSFALLALCYQTILWGWTRFLRYIGLDRFPLWTRTAYADTRPIIIREFLTREWKFFKNTVSRHWYKMPTCASLGCSTVIWVRSFLRNLRRYVLQLSCIWPYFQDGGVPIPYLVSQLVRCFRLLVSVYIFNLPFAALLWILSIVGFLTLRRVTSVRDIVEVSVAWPFWLYEILMWLLLMHFTLLAHCFDIMDNIIAGSFDAVKELFWTVLHLWPLLIWSLFLGLWNAFFWTGTGSLVLSLGAGSIDPTKVGNDLRSAHWILLVAIVILLGLPTLCCCYRCCPPPPPTPSPSPTDSNYDQDKKPWRLGSNNGEVVEGPTIFFPRSLDGLPDDYQPSFDMLRVERLVRAVFTLSPGTQLDARGQLDLEATGRLSDDWLAMAIADVVGVLLRTDFPHLTRNPRYHEFNKALTVMVDSQTQPAEFSHAQEVLRQLGTPQVVGSEPDIEEPFRAFLTITLWFSNLERDILRVANYHATQRLHYPTPQKEARAIVTAFQEGRRNDALRHWILLEGSLDEWYYPYGSQPNRPVPAHVRGWDLTLYHRAAVMVAQDGPLTGNAVLFARRALSRFYYDESLLGRYALEEAIRLLKDHPTRQPFPFNWPEKNLEDDEKPEEEPVVEGQPPQETPAAFKEPSIVKVPARFDTTEPIGLSDKDLLTFRKVVKFLAAARAAPPGKRSYVATLESIINFFRQGESVRANARYNRLLNRLPPLDRVREAIEDVQRIQDEEIRRLSNERRVITPIPLSPVKNSGLSPNPVLTALQKYNLGVIIRDIESLFQTQPALGLDTLIQEDLRESGLSDENTFNDNIRNIADSLVPDFKYLGGYVEYDLFMKAMRIAASLQTSQEDFTAAHQALLFLISGNLVEAEQILAKIGGTQVVQYTEVSGLVVESKRKSGTLEPDVRLLADSRVLELDIQSMEDNEIDEPDTAPLVVQPNEKNGIIQPIIETPNKSEHQLKSNRKVVPVDSMQGPAEIEPQSPFDPSTPVDLSLDDQAVYQMATDVMVRVNRKELKEKATGDAEQVIRYLRRNKTKVATDMMRRLERTLPDLKLGVETPAISTVLLTPKSQQSTVPAEL